MSKKKKMLIWLMYLSLSTHIVVHSLKHLNDKTSCQGYLIEPYEDSRKYAKSLLVVCLDCATPWIAAAYAPLSMGFLSKSIGVG